LVADGAQVRAEGFGLGEQADEGDALAESEEMHVGQRVGGVGRGGEFEQPCGDADGQKAADAVTDEEGFLSGIPAVALEDVFGHGMGAVLQLREMA
jgi:hypothetical protein